MKTYYKWWTIKIPDRDNQKPTEKMVGPHLEGRLPPKNYN